MTRAISIDDTHKELNPFFWNVFFFLKRFKKFIRLNYTIIILIKFFKSLEQELLLIAG